MIVAPLTPSHTPLAQQDQQYYYPLYPTITHYPHTYNFMPSSSSDCFDADLQHGGKRVKVEQQHQEHYQHHQPLLSYFPDNTLDYSSFNTAAGLSQSHLHAPQINLDKASDQPGSPLTVTTTLSQYSTPSRSPTRVSIHSDTAHSDWALFDDSMAGTLTHDIPKDRNTNSLHSNQLQQTSVTTPSSTASTTAQAHMRSAFPYQMNSAALNGQYYAGFPIPDFTKLSQHPVLNPYGPPPYSNHQQAQNNNLHQQHEEDLPALSPSTRYQPSSNQSAREELRSPMTPLGSPVSNDGDRAPNARTSAPREDTHIYIFNDEMDDSLLFPLLDLHNPLPKFTRTVSDAVEDELFRSSPLDASKSQTSQKHQIKTPISPTLATYFQQAQKDHVLDSTRSNAQHGFVSREKSPFRANSPFHPTRTPQGVQVTPVRRNVINYITAQGKREQQQELDMQSINQHMMMNEADQLASTPKTISPKDALLDYPEPEDEASKLSLFPHEQNTTTQFGNNNASSQAQSHNHTHFQSTDMGDGNDSEISYPSSSRRGSEAESISSIGAFSYHHSPLMQQNLPFPFQTLGSSTEAGSPSLQDKSSTSHSPTMSKPEGSRADSGAYTCTASGCQQRFQTPAKLQKHKRENHRQSSPAGPSGMTSTLQGGVNRLQGPHRCARINPTTGKPCNTIFSRPYDLTRHDDTIHNTSREKVRCEICNDEKTFSRQDALTRHKKVKHGIDK